MAINFKSGPPRPPVARPIDPIQIFQGRPALENQINDVWRGQATALSQWFQSTENDILISLNTGAGKSVVGTLICQSWLNSGVQNPVYLCATNDLVEQTAREATKLALDFTTRSGGAFSNEKFETGKGFLVTSYQTMLNARTVLRSDLSPGGIIFDDAHVGEPVIRGQYTLSINSQSYKDIHTPLIELTLSLLSTTDRQRLRFVLEGQGHGLFLCPPSMGHKLSPLLSQLHAKFNADGRADIGFPYALLATKFHACAVVISKFDIELSPPFLPSRVIPALNDPSIRRVYLSATLKAESEFIRAYGRRPGLIIEPEVDAGNGERTVINSGKLKDSAQLVSWAHSMSRKTKALVATPSRSASEVWKPIATPPKREEFAEKLRQFKAAQAGGFVLAGRFDGIDLPDATCRLMIISGLPSGGSLLETYLWQAFEMQNFLSARVATRITQLFGRIIRGRNDFGLFVLQGKSLTNWLERDRNLALLPDLLQKQVKLGQVLQDDFELDSTASLGEFYQQVIDRESGWLDYYRSYIETQNLDFTDKEKRRLTEEAQQASALLEAKFMEMLWRGRFVEAAASMEAEIDKLASSDAKLAGWLNLWVGAAYECDGKTHLAFPHYRIASSRLRLEMELPYDPEDNLGEPADYISASVGALNALSRTSFRIFKREKDKVVERITHATSAVATTSGSEEAYRALGAFCGLDSSRPDMETSAGPDVLWIDRIANKAVSFELKTGKLENPELSKKEIGQSHNHIQWIADNYPGVNLIKHFIVGTELTVSSFGNPDHSWCLSEPHEAVSFVTAFLVEAERLRNLGPDLRKVALENISANASWSIDAMSEKLCSRPIG